MGKKCSEVGCLNIATRRGVCVAQGARNKKRCTQEGCTCLRTLRMKMDSVKGMTQRSIIAAETAAAIKLKIVESAVGMAQGL